MAEKKIEMSLPKFSLDDFFTTQEQRDDAKLEKIRDISIDNIDEFANHPFKVLENEDMKNLIDSIKNSGVVEPVILRERSNGRYEMISGHRRMKACMELGIKTIPSIVRKLSNDEATIIMVDSNLKREKLLPSEKAFAYKMKLEALKHQGKRQNTTYAQVGHKLGNKVSREIVADDVGESREQIRRYIRLTELIPEILEMVDKEEMAFNPAVEVSFLGKDMQYSLLDYMEYFDATPSHSQAIEMKKLFQSSELKIDNIKNIMKRDKPNQVEKIKLSAIRIRSALPRNITEDKVEDYVVNALVFYDKHLKHKQMDSR